MSNADRELLSRMEADINEGTAALFEAYGGLVWSACARRLQDPEDIKECVNDTFADFSRCWQRFDGEKGSLGNYLCTIALRRAAERYRKNAAADRAEERYREDWLKRQADQTEDPGLSDALEQLDPVDARILREKYYNGMTYQQIAEAMGLPYETVKKRGQRNLRKLRAILIGLILALLAAGCAYMIYRSFQFAEGAGPNFDASRPIYQLADVEGEPYALEMGVFYLEDAIYQDGQLHVELGVSARGEWPETGEADGRQVPRSSMFGSYINLLSDMDVTDANGVSLGDASSSQYTILLEAGIVEYLFAWEAEETADVLQLHIRLTLGEQRQSAWQYCQDLGLVTEADREKLRSTPAEWTVTLEKLDFVDEREQIGTFRDYLDTGLLIRDGTACSDGSYVSVCPYQNESVYTLAPFLSKGYTGAYDERSITLTAADGTVYPADRVYGASLSPLDERKVCFPEAPAGDYTLTIPYLCVSTEDQTASVTVPLPAGLGQEIALDETVFFSDGSGIRLTKVRYEQEETYGAYTEEDGTFVEGTMDVWNYVFEYELLSSGGLILFSFGGDSLLPTEVQDLEGYISSRGTPNEFVVSFNEVNNLHRVCYEAGSAYEVTLTFHTPVYILDEPIEAQVTVYGSEP